MLTPHREYRLLGKTAAERQAAYRQLFRARLAEKTMDEIRQATNKAWVLGDDRFKAKIERQLDRQVVPSEKGGDRKSELYRRNKKINRV